MLNYAEARKIIRIYFGLVFLYPVHPSCRGEAFKRRLVDSVRKWTVYAVKILNLIKSAAFQASGGAEP